MGREDGEGKLGLLTVLSHFLFVFKTAEHPLLLTHLQPSRLKINFIHSFLVSLSPAVALGDRFLKWGPAKFCPLVPVCSLHGTSQESHIFSAVYSFEIKICISISALVENRESRQLEPNLNVSV